MAGVKKKTSKKKITQYSQHSQNDWEFISISFNVIIIKQLGTLKIRKTLGDLYESKTNILIVASITSSEATSRYIFLTK